jgi:cold shock CspA family protein
MQGSVKSYMSERAYGFIRGDDAVDYYFGTYSLPEGYIPKPGDRVAFETQENRNRPGAFRVTGTLVKVVAQK